MPRLSHLHAVAFNQSPSSRFPQSGDGKADTVASCMASGCNVTEQEDALERRDQL
jgi:hypothetical protein